MSSSNSTIMGKELDVMKVLTMFLVVLGHITNKYGPNAIVEHAIEIPFFESLSEIIYKFHMPAFFAISGAVYFICKRKLGKYKNEKAFIIKKFHRLVIPYAVFALCWVLPCMYIVGKVDTSLPRYIFYSYIVGLNSRHLWYLYALFCIFVLFSLMEETAFKRPKTILIILLLFYFSSPHILYYFQASSIATYMIYFYIGYISYNWCDKMQHKAVLVIASVLLFVVLCHVEKSIYHPLASSLFSLLEALSGTLFLYGGSSLLTERTKIVRNCFFAHLSLNSFGIYLFHPMLIYYMFFFTRHLCLNPYVLAMLCLFTTYLLSSMLTDLTRKAKISFIIGE